MKVMVTAGPTREFIDPVRFLSNRSTGKMGFAVAAALCQRGHEVVLVSGPVAISVPHGVRLVSVVTADDMLNAVNAEFGWCDALVMAAAVADWRPRKAAVVKLKKKDGAPQLDLVSTTDILGQLADRKGTKVMAGFSAETSSPAGEGRRKLLAKNLDVVFANDVSLNDAGFEVDTNRIVCITATGAEETWPLMSKTEAGLRIAQTVEKIYDERHA